MSALLIVGVDPGAQTGVQILKGRRVTESRYELGTDGAEQTFDLTASFRHPGFGVQERDAQTGASVAKLVSSESRPIIDIQLTR